MNYFYITWTWFTNFFRFRILHLCLLVVLSVCMLWFYVNFPIMTSSQHDVLVQMKMFSLAMNWIMSPSKLMLWVIPIVTVFGDRVFWCWERLKAGGEGDDRGWDGWMASLTQWTWVWANSGGCWWTGKPGVLQSMGLQRVGHDWVTEMNWTEVTLVRP